MESPNDIMDLLRRVAADWPPGGWSDVHVLVAVSGGADSVALVRAIFELKRIAGGAGRLFVGHVNHRLRGSESDADETWVAELCHEMGISFAVRQASEPVVRRDEDALRNGRRRLLVEMAEEKGARFIAPAHTLDDQVETVLFRLLRGSGLRGLAGMPRVRPLSTSVALVRPLLACSRAELRSYLARLGQEWREDSSNAQLNYARNRLRHEILPRLRQDFDADEALLRVSAQAAEAEGLIASFVEPVLAACAVAIGPLEISLRVEPLASQSPMMVAEALRATWRQAGWPEQAMTRRWWTALADLARFREARPAINLPGNVLARRDDSMLRLERRSANA